MSSYSGIGKILTCWKLFIKYVHLLSGVGRGDNVAGAWTFECSLYVIEENDVKGFDDAWHGLFVKAKRDIEMLPQTHGTLELHIIRVNYRAKILLQSDHVIMDLENKPTETIGLLKGTDGLEVDWKRLPTTPDACL